MSEDFSEDESSVEEFLDCILSVDEFLSEIEEFLDKKQYREAIAKVREAKECIAELKIDDEAFDDRQEVDLHIAKILK